MATAGVKGLKLLPGKETGQRQRLRNAWYNVGDEKWQQALSVLVTETKRVTCVGAANVIKSNRLWYWSTAPRADI